MCIVEAWKNVGSEEGRTFMISKSNSRPSSLYFVETSKTGTQKRTLPYMPKLVNGVTDAITERRMHNLDAYVKNLLAQPHYISSCTLVKQFFTPHEGGYGVDPNFENHNDDGASLASFVWETGRVYSWLRENNFSTF